MSILTCAAAAVPGLSRARRPDLLPDYAAQEMPSHGSGAPRQELTISASLIIACTDRLRDLPGPVSVRLGKIIRVPEGEAYLAVEAPLGIAGVFLVSRGEKTPWRLKLRTPSFNNISSLERLLVGRAYQTRWRRPSPRLAMSSATSTSSRRRSARIARAQKAQYLTRAGDRPRSLAAPC